MVYISLLKCNGESGNYVLDERRPKASSSFASSLDFTNSMQELNQNPQWLYIENVA